MIDFNIGKVKYCDYELLEQLSNDLSLDYSIATHNIFLDKSNKKYLSKKIYFREPNHKDFANSIIKKGLVIDKAWTDIFYTVTGYGYLKNILENKDERKNTFVTYNYWKETKVNNVIIAIPPTIRLDGKEYFIGVLENNYYSVMRDFPKGENLLNHVLLSYKIPSEFIYGVYSRNILEGEKENSVTLENFKDKKVFSLMKNPHHVSKMTEQQKQNFYERLLEEKNISIELLRCIENGRLSSNSPILNTTILQKESYEREFHGQKR